MASFHLIIVLTNACIQTHVHIYTCKYINITCWVCLVLFITLWFYGYMVYNLEEDQLSLSIILNCLPFFALSWDLLRFPLSMLVWQWWYHLQVMFKQSYCWGYRGKGSLSYIKGKIWQQMSGTLTLTMFLPPISLCSLSHKNRGLCCRCISCGWTPLGQLFYVSWPVMDFCDCLYLH